MKTSIVLSIIIPAYNEEASIERVIKDHVQVIGNISGYLKDWEMVCLDDASTDRTCEIVSRFSQEYDKVRLVRHLKNEGIYVSYTDLAKHARGTHIYQTAADGQWPAENLERLLKYLVNNSLDLVIGIRENRKEIYSPWRYLLSKVFNFIPKVLFGFDTKDANGIKLGRREVFQIDLISKSFFMEIERILEAHKRGLKIGFSPIIFLSRFSGKARGAKWMNIFNTLCDCVKYKMSTNSKTHKG